MPSRRTVVLATALALACIGLTPAFAVAKTIGPFPCASFNKKLERYQKKAAAEIAKWTRKSKRATDPEHKAGYLHATFSFKGQIAGAKQVQELVDQQSCKRFHYIAVGRALRRKGLAALDDQAAAQRRFNRTGKGEDADPLELASGHVDAFSRSIFWIKSEAEKVGITWNIPPLFANTF